MMSLKIVTNVLWIHQLL